MRNAAGKQQTKTTKTDSLFGMALTSAFLGVAFGDVFEQVFDAGELCSAVYEDRKAPKRTNGRGVHELGKKGSLAGMFTGAGHDKPAARPLSFDAWMKPVGAPAFAF